MIKNIVSLILGIVIIFAVADYKVFAMKDNPFHEFGYCDGESEFLNKLGVDQLRNKFFDQFKKFDEDRQRNKFLIEENRDLNREIKDKLKESKSNISQDVWKEIRNYKNEINDNKINTKVRIKELIDEQKKVVQNSDYSDESIKKFISVLIDAQELRRESIEFERDYLQKINYLIL